MDCQRCGGTGSIVEQGEYFIYEYPPIRCAVCNPTGEIREPQEKISECPDCRVIDYEDELASIERAG